MTIISRIHCNQLMIISAYLRMLEGKFNLLTELKWKFQFLVNKLMEPPKSTSTWHASNFYINPFLNNNRKWRGKRVRKQLLNIVIKVLKPNCTSLFQHFLELPVKLKSHDCVRRADELSSNEHGWNCGAAPELHQRPFHFPTSWILIELVDRRAHPLLIEQSLYSMAHATRTLAEDHHGFLRS